MKQNENLFTKMDEIVAKYLSEERPSGAFATSLDIANMTGREHRNVLRDIRNILENMKNSTFFNQLMVEPIEYVDKKGRTYPAFSMDQNSFLHIITKFDDEARWILVMAYNELLKLQPARPEQLIKADFTTADLAWEHLQEIAFIKDRLSKAKTQEEIDHWNNLIKEEENKFIEECKKYNLY